MSNGKNKDEDRRNRSKEKAERKPAVVTVSVDAYSLVSQRRAIVYGRARGRS